MPRVHHVKKAQKDYPNAGIKKGEPYYWWKFRFGAKHKSKTPPRRSQLTQSDFLGQMYDIEDAISEAESFSGSTKEEFAAWQDDLRSNIESWCDDIRQLGEECEEKKYNMPEGLQEGDVGQLLEERASACEDMASELENIDLEPDIDEPDEDDDEDEDNDEKEGEKSDTNPYEEAAESIISEVQQIGYGGE